MMLDKSTAPTKGNEGWLPALIFGAYLLISWLPDDYLPFTINQWYIFLAMAGFLFLLNQQGLDADKSAVLWVGLGLQFMGAVLAVLRADNPDRALWNAVGFGGNVIGLILLVPLAARPVTRKIVLYVLMIVASIWSIEIQRLINRYGFLTYSTFGRNLEGNKNFIGFLLTMAGLTLFYLALFWKPKRSAVTGNLLVYRLIMTLIGVVYIFSIALIYARSSLVTALFGLIFILIRLFLSSPKEQRLFRVVLFAGVAAMVIVVLIPLVGKISPLWSDMIEGLSDQGLESFPTRLLLIRKGWTLVGQNPFIGVGIGGTRSAFESATEIFKSTFIHNLYLTEWAEKGILGLISYLVWIVVLVRYLFKKFNRLTLIDQILILLIFVSFIEMNFMDGNTLAFIMMLLFTGMMHSTDDQGEQDG